MTLTADFMTDFTANKQHEFHMVPCFSPTKFKLQGIFKNCRCPISLQGLDHGSCIKLGSGYHPMLSNGKQWKLNVVKQPF